jgi:hypothetical protein
MKVIFQLFVYDFSRCASEYEFNRKQLRLQEHCVCLLKNCCDPSIDSLHIFVENKDEKVFYSQVTSPYGDKATYIVHGRQPTYKELVEYAANTFSDGDIVCIMNSDIVFNSEKDHELIRKVAKPKRLISLTRHELTDETHSICNLTTCPWTEAGGSSDVFIFKMPIPNDFPFSRIDHKQNMFGAEHVFHKAWHDSGYEIYNPCDDIITIHIHRDRTHFFPYENIDNEDGTNAAYNPKVKLVLDE